VTDRIVVVGALNADLGIRVDRLPAPGETVSGRDVEVSPGGKASNQAVAAARLGGEVLLIGAVGDDEHGLMLRERAAAAGVDVATVEVLPDVVTGQAIIPVDDDGENAIILVPGANGALTPDHIPAEEYTDAAVVCLSLEVPIVVVQRAAALGAGVGATVLLNPSPFRPLPDELLDASDVLVMNGFEASQLLGEVREPRWPEGVDAVRVALEPHDITRFVITRGAKGSIVVDGAVVSEIAATPVDAVDTTGAGDAFTGALAVGLAEGRPLVDAAREASVVAALSTTRRGAQSSYPTRAELEALR
jgi:ribokinase